MTIVLNKLKQDQEQRVEQNKPDLSGSFPYDKNGKPMTAAGAYIMTAEMEGYTGLPINEETTEATWKDWRDSQPNSRCWDIYDMPLTLPKVTVNGKKIELSE